MEHPPQPIVMVDRVRRFRQNPIVRYLLDTNQHDLNKLFQVGHGQGWSNEDWSQVYQLIGYSVSGYAEMSFVTDAECKRVTQDGS